MLLTGDARGDHIIEGLQQIGALSVGGTIKIDALKVPHHGSRQNTDRDFFDRVIADHYVITGNGKSGNPPAATFETIAESARDSGRRVNFWVTTRTSAVNEFCRRFPPQTWPYEVHVLPADRHSMTIELARSTA